MARSRVAPRAQSPREAGRGQAKSRREGRQGSAAGAQAKPVQLRHRSRPRARAARGGDVPSLYLTAPLTISVSAETRFDVHASSGRKRARAVVAGRELRGSGGDDAGDASEPREQRSSARRGDSWHGGEQRLGGLLTPTGPRTLRVGGALSGRLELLAANGQTMDPERRVALVPGAKERDPTSSRDSSPHLAP